MPLPYENATSGKNAIEQIQRILREFGCDRFATGEDFANGEVFVQFEHRGRQVRLSASARGYAAAWLRENPWTTRRRCTKTEHERHALQIGGVAVYSMLRDWVKGQVTAIEVGIMTFDAAFLAHILLPGGKTVIEDVCERRLLAPAPIDAEIVQ